MNSISSQSRGGDAKPSIISHAKKNEVSIVCSSQPRRKEDSVKSSGSDKSLRIEDYCYWYRESANNITESSDPEVSLKQQKWIEQCSEPRKRSKQSKKTPKGRFSEVSHWTTWTTLKAIKGSTWCVIVSGVSDPEEYRSISEATEVMKQMKAAVEKKQMFWSRTENVEAASSKEQLEGGKILVCSILGNQLRSSRATDRCQQYA